MIGVMIVHKERRDRHLQKLDREQHHEELGRVQGIRQGKGEISETAISSHGCYRRIWQRNMT